MVKADAMEMALKTLKFDRFEKVYAAKLRMKVSERALATQLGTSIPNVKQRIKKARKGAAKKVLHQCRKNGKLDAERLRNLVTSTGIDGKLVDVTVKRLQAFTTTRSPGEDQIKEIDSFLARVFKSEQWTTSIAWRNKRHGLTEARKRIRERHEQRYTAGVTKKISWEEVGEGVLNETNKGSPTWTHWRTVMDRNIKDPERRSLLNMLGNEMELLYGRYRRAAERQDGKSGRFIVFGGEKRHARTVAEHCLMRDVHPVELLQYWDRNIGNFTDNRYPTLAFLKGAHAIEALAAKRQQKDAKPSDGNSYSNIQGLHPKFRRHLEEAGFRTQRYPDRMLLSIQFMASMRVRGKRFFIDSLDKRKMIEWAAKNWNEIFPS